MAGLFSRLKTWIQDEKLLFGDQNSEFDNILAHSELQYMKGHSDSVNQMRLTENPGSQGSEATGSSISGADELERLRFVISRMIGGTYWYDTPSASINQLTTALNIGGAVPLNRITDGRVNSDGQPMFLVPSGTGATTTIKAASTNLLFVVNGISYVLDSDVTSSALTLSPGKTTTLSDDAYAFDNEIFINAAASGFEVGTYSAFKNSTTGEIFFGYIEKNTLISTCMRGIFFNSAEAVIPASDQTSGQTLVELKTNWVFLRSDNTVSVCSTMPTYSAIAPTTPQSGDYWFDFSAGIWKRFSGSSWDISNAALVGIAICDSTSCVAARSFDFYRSYSDVNTINLSVVSNTTIRTTNVGYQISVYGNTFQTKIGQKVWDITTDLDGSESPSTEYFLYIKNNGQSVFSTVRPIDRNHDLKGYYHPSKPWRCVGVSYNNASSNLITVSSIVDTQVVATNWSDNFGLTSPVAEWVQIQNLDIKTNTKGRLLLVTLVPNTVDGEILVTSDPYTSGTAMAYVKIMRDDEDLVVFPLRIKGTGVVHYSVPASSIQAWDLPPPGVHTYTAHVMTTLQTTIYVKNCRLNVIDLQETRG